MWTETLVYMVQELMVLQLQQSMENVFKGNSWYKSNGTKDGYVENFIEHRMEVNMQIQLWFHLLTFVYKIQQTVHCTGWWRKPLEYPCICMHHLNYVLYGQNG